MEQQVFNLTELNGPEIDVIVAGLNELPAKQSRLLLNKIETQIIRQLQQQQAAAAAAAEKKA